MDIVKHLLTDVDRLERATRRTSSRLSSLFCVAAAYVIVTELRTKQLRDEVCQLKNEIVTLKQEKGD